MNNTLQVRENTKEIIIWSLCLSTLCFIFWAFFGLFWLGVSDNKVERLQIKTDACYQEYRYDTTRETHWLHIDHCGAGENK